MIPSASALKKFLTGPDPAVRVVLLHGADEGLMRERAQHLSKAVLGDGGGAVRRLTAKAILDDPSLLFDGAASMSLLTSGREVIRIDDASEKLAKLLEEFIADPPGDNLVILLAGSLTKKNRLRALLEKAKNAAAIACYEDNSQTLSALIRDMVGKANMTLTTEAEQFLRDHLGSDRMTTRMEMEKLLMYMGAWLPDGPPQTEITLADVTACIGDNAATAFDATGAAALRGEGAAAMLAYEKALLTGQNPVGVLRILSRRLSRLHAVATAIDQGDRFDTAARGLRPPAFGSEQSEMRDLLGRWTAGRLTSALGLVMEAEVACKTTGLPAEVMCGRAILRLANAARR